MADNIEKSIYDDAEAVKFIQEHLPQEVKGKYSDDDVLLITDIVRMVGLRRRRGNQHRR